MRGHVLTTTGKRLEDVGIPDFIDIVYAYSINSPDKRTDFRSAMLGYLFDFKEEAVESAEEMTFDGFQRQSLSMIDELDAFQLG